MTKSEPRPPVGHRSRPYLRPPPRYSIEGMPFGAFCLCGRCGHAARNTHAFGYHAEGVDCLICDHCLYGVPYKAGHLVSRDIDDGDIRSEPLGPRCRGGYDEGLG